MGSTKIPQGAVSRRTLLRGAAGGAALIAAGRLPAWAKPTVSLAGVRKPNTLPFPHMPAGTESMREIRHVVVVMMENHSFDNMLGKVAHQVPGRRSVDGWTMRNGRVVDSNPDSDGHPVRAKHARTPCQPDHVPSQSWNASHESFNHGHMDGFVRASGPFAMRYWDEHDLPFTYSLVKHFPMGQRYFSSVLAQTYPNRRFLFSGTASGTVSTDTSTFRIPAENGTIWDRLDAHGITYTTFFQNLPSWAIIPGTGNGRAQFQRKLDHFFPAVAAGRLPQFTFLDPNYNTTSQENPQDVQVGEAFLARITHALMKADTWRHTALFITYDEHGGYYDHVKPPRAIKPDNIPPKLGPGDVHAAYDRYGFRVPLIVVSPYARKNYVSSVVQDHTSILAFVERKWNLPAMTFRDANADAMTDYFDFRRPAFPEPPSVAQGPPLGPGADACHAAGYNPPLPTSRNDGAGDVSRRR